jgi:putative ABC transport system permease protein
MNALWQDLRYGARMLWKRPGFTLMAILTLALSIGANTTIFSVVNSVLIRPLPFPDPDRLVLLWETRLDNPGSLNIVSAPNYLDWQQRNSVFESMAMFDSAGKGYNLSGGSDPERVSGVRVSWSFFETLGVRPRLGRSFLPEEETFGKHRVVVLSDGLWRSRYGADPTLVGQTIKLDSEDYTVVGVMPPSFEFQFWSDRRQLWVPIYYTEGDHERGSHSFVAFARLKPGVTLAEASAEMDTIGRGLAQAYPQANAGKSALVMPMGEYGQKYYRATWLALLGAAGFVLLIACVNVANLLMARGAARQREFAIRLALGASRWRTIRQLLTESLLLAVAGGFSGILVALWSSSLLVTILPGDLKAIPFRPLGGLPLDFSVLLFTWAITGLTGVLFGLGPALILSRHHVGDTLQEGGRGASRGGGPGLRQALVVTEIALALIVLTGAGLMIESMGRLLKVAPGLDPENVLTLNMSLPQENLYYSPPAHPRFAAELAERVGRLPGVVSVSAISHLPLGGGQAGRGFTIEGRPTPAPEDEPGAGYSVICPNYFQTMGIALVSGREFTVQDDQNAPGVIIINESMARQYWPDEDPLGKRIQIGGAGPWQTIVGVARDVRRRLDEQTEPEFFRPYSQAAWPTMTIVLRTAATPLAFVNPVKKALAEIEPERPVSDISTMKEVVHNSLGPRRFPMLLLLAFSLLALTLAAVGISGVVSFSVTQRTREIGIRLALGAQRRDVLMLVLRRSLGATLAGVGLGLLGSFALTRFLTNLLFEVKPLDPVVLVTVALLLTGVALLAGYIPGRRATKVDPMVALRYE